MKERLKKAALDSGACLFGVADISSIKKDFHLDNTALKGIDRAISMAYSAIAVLPVPVGAETSTDSFF